MLYKTLLTMCFIIASSAVSFAQAPAAPHPPAPGQSPQEEPRPVLTVPPGYKYAANGRRDPFVNPVPKPTPKGPGAIASLRPPGLKGVLVSEAQISGVVNSREPGMNRAVIGGPGGKTYFASKGDSLYDAVIKDIQADAVVFELKSLAADKEVKTPNREIVRKIRTTP
jgi:hypothetical protein